MITPTGVLVEHLCDGHANGSTSAVVRVHIGESHVLLCGHCFRKNEATFVAAEYDVEVLDEAMMIRPKSLEAVVTDGG